jgi:hypothetical protein
MLTGINGIKSMDDCAQDSVALNISVLLVCLWKENPSLHSLNVTCSLLPSNASAMLCRRIPSNRLHKVSEQPPNIVSSRIRRVAVQCRERPSGLVYPCLTSPATRAIASLGTVGGLGGLGGLGDRRVANLGDHHLGGVFFGVVDVLSVVPVACRDVAVADGDSSGPRGSATCPSVRPCSDSLTAAQLEDLPRRSETTLNVGSGRRRRRHSAGGTVG